MPNSKPHSIEAQHLLMSAAHYLPTEMYVELRDAIGRLQEQIEAACQDASAFATDAELESQENDRLKEQFETLRKVADGLFQMIDRETWRATGGDDQQGHYEGDYRAAQMEEYLVSLRPSNPASSPPFVSESASAYDKTMDAIDAMNRRKASNPVRSPNDG